ncbi:LysR family transcriptional regulator [Moraxella bovoculi]|uniref:LysR family transcriptional regulator n=1 Tax=Moraxella bovoculi TaxID=386891 RepID=UPI003F504810
MEIVRSKSFSKAGVRLSMPKSTLSERIKRLEKSLGVQLLNRTTPKIELTEAGELYFDKAQKNHR